MLKVKDLRIVFPTRKGMVKAVDGISFTLPRGGILGLVGESGCGKSVTLMSMLRLLPYPGQVVGGSIRLNGKDILSLKLKEMRRIRGREMSIIFQDPMTTLNPVIPVGEQVTEALRVHGLGGGGLRRFVRSGRDGGVFERAVELLREVGVAAPEERFFQYPHEFSGGMQQRALIAIALACSPNVLLADEPTTALDVTVQAQILDLLDRVNRARKTSIIFVTHDLGVAAQFCQSIAVMYAGKIVENGPAFEVLENPYHPYTQGLLRSIPQIGDKKKKLSPIFGLVPDLTETDERCSFYDRCGQRQEICRSRPVEMTVLSGERRVLCHLCGEQGVDESA